MKTVRLKVVIGWEAFLWKSAKYLWAPDITGESNVEDVQPFFHADDVL
jgi:hypothetical protein